MELQSPTSNGFKPLTSQTLRKRFGAATSHTFYGSKVKSSVVLIDAESLSKNREFIDLLGYLNTSNESQLKGKSGYVK